MDDAPAPLQAVKCSFLLQRAVQCLHQQSVVRIVADIGSYERMCGVHLSMGAKHHVYKKPGIKKKHVRHHVDVFVVADALSFDGEVVYSGGSWTVGQG